MEMIESKCSTSSESGELGTRINSIRNPNVVNSSYLHSQTYDKIVDSLTSHISLYHSRSIYLRRANLNKPSSDRSSILKWFSSLNVHQRQSHLTIVDYECIQLLIRMVSKIQSHGCGRFIILPDILEGNLPSLCYKKSTGLLLRVDEADQAERDIVQSVWLFGSREGEIIKECACSVSSLDTLTLADELVKDLDRFVYTMDYISGGEFLRGEEGDLSSDWVELEWLKGRGYYTIGAFIGNIIEVSLRLAWKSKCATGKKRGIKLKEKLARQGMAVNVFWRKKGCLDWWQSLSDVAKSNILNSALGKAAKSLVSEVLKECSNVMGLTLLMDYDGSGHSSRSEYSGLFQRKTKKTSFSSHCGRLQQKNSFKMGIPSYELLSDKLYVLQDVVALVSPSWHSESNMLCVHFSTLESVCGVRDGILRKLRGLLMFISLACTKLELYEETYSKMLPKKPNKNVVASESKKNGKNHTIRKSKLQKEEPNLKHNSKLKQKTGITESVSSNPSPIDLRCIETGQEKDTVKKNKKVRGKNRRPRVNKSVTDLQHLEVLREIPTKLPLMEELIAGGELEHSKSTSSISKDLIANNPSIPFTATSFIDNLENTETPNVLNLTDQEGLLHVDLQLSEKVGVDRAAISTIDGCTCASESEYAADVLSTFSIDSSRSDFESKMNYIKGKLDNVAIQETPLVFEEKSLSCGESAEKKLYDCTPASCLSYGWPKSTGVYFQPVYSSTLPAADRLHLDVGDNSRSNVRQPLVQTVCSVRRPLVEGACSQLLSRTPPMNLDWPPNGFAPSWTCTYDSEFVTRRNNSYIPNYSNYRFQRVPFSGNNNDDERQFIGDSVNLSEIMMTQELIDDCDAHWMSEDDFEMHAVSGMDYNQYFGGGVMYWDPSDQPGSGFSRPPSLSSDDSLWAWHEADANRTVDDIVTFSSSYSANTNGLTSPRASSFCSPFDPLVSGHQPLNIVVSANDLSGKFLRASSASADAIKDDISVSMTPLSGKIEGRAIDTAYPSLRPIIIPNMSKRNHDPKSPSLSTRRQNQARTKRPPSPIVLCVRPPPPPSPVNDSRKHRGFPIVRSGSSSPRHWGMRGWYQEGINLDETCVRFDVPEIVWPSRRNKNLSTKHPMIQPMTGSFLQDRLFAMSHFARDQEYPDVSFPFQSPTLEASTARKTSLSIIHNILHDEIDYFCRQVSAANVERKPFINWAVKRVSRSLQVLWPRSRTNVFGSNATGLSLPTSDVDLVVCLPPVRNLEPIKEAGILEGRNGIKETCLQHAARYLANQEWVKSDSLRTVENTAIPLIMLVVEVPVDLVTPVCNVQPPEEECYKSLYQEEGSQSEVLAYESASQIHVHSCDNVKDVKCIRLDISFKSPTHTGLQTTELVKAVTEKFPAAIPLALVLKQFLADRNLDRSYSGGLSSYCLVLLVTRFLQHEHQLGRMLDKNLGGLLMDFLYFFGNVFDPRQMRISVQGNGVYIKRARECSIDPLCIDDPLFPMNNVGRNCFRIHQCIKAFAEAYCTLEKEPVSLDWKRESNARAPFRLLPKIVPSVTLHGNLSA